MSSRGELSFASSRFTTRTAVEFLDGLPWSFAMIVMWKEAMSSRSSGLVVLTIPCKGRKDACVKSHGSILLGDLKTRKSTGSSCQIEIHFSSQTSKFLIKYNLLWFQISGGLIIFFTEHDYKVSTSFTKETATGKAYKHEEF